MSNPDEVFIGLAVYNRIDLLEQAIDSLLRQTHRNIKILAADDCSTDPEVQPMLEAIAAREPRFIYRRNPQNLGVTLNFRSLIDDADSPFFMWASDDDIWEPTFVERMMDELRNNDGARLAFCTVDNINNSGQTIRRLPGFSYLSTTGDPVRDAEAFLRDPEIMGKANIIHGVFDTASLKEVVDIGWDICDFMGWGGDLVLMFAFVTRFRTVVIDDVLLHKRVPTDDASQLDFGRAESHFPTGAIYESYLERLRAVAPSPEVAACIRPALEARARDRVKSRRADWLDRWTPWR